MAEHSLSIGIPAQILGAVLFLSATTCLKRFSSVGLVYQITLILTALFVPSFIALMSYNSVEPKKQFDFRQLFTDHRRRSIGIWTFIYFLCSYCSFKLLPLTLSMPLFFTFPVILIVASVWIDNKPFPSWQQNIGTLVLFAGILSFMIDGISSKFNTTLVVGLLLGLLGAIGSALRYAYTAEQPKMVVPSRTTKEVRSDNVVQRGAFDTLSIQLLESSTLPLIGFVVLSVLLSCVPTSWKSACINKGVPAALLNTDNGAHWGTIPLMFLVFLCFSYTANGLFTVADDRLSPPIYGTMLYRNVLLSVAFGYFFLGERVTIAKIIGMLLIVIGGAYLIYLNQNKSKVRHSIHSNSTLEPERRAQTHPH